MRDGERRVGRVWGRVRDAVDVVFVIVYVFFEVVELCFVSLYYALTAEGAKVIYVKFVS